MTDDPRSLFDHTPPAPDTHGWADAARRRATRAGTAVRMGLVTAGVIAGVAVSLIATSL